MSLWQSYRKLSPRTRMAIGGGVMGYALVALYVSDQAERKFGFTPTEQDRQRLHEAVPKIHVVDRAQK